MRNPVRPTLLLAVIVALLALTSCSPVGGPVDTAVGSSPTTPSTAPTTGPTASTTTPPSGAEPEPGATAPPSATTGELTVRFLDVGQGDATLLTTDDATLLIDAGRHDRSDVVDALSSYGVDTIDLVAITHPHADHIGQLDEVIAAADVGEVWMSGATATTDTYGRAMDAVERNGVGYEEPRTGDTATFGSLVVEVLHPSRLTGDIHSDMLALRVTHGATSFLFTGDAEGPVELALTSAANVGATVYQVGHHGSATSTTAGFLAAVNPSVAVYSAGAGNTYGHPHPDVVARLRGAGVDVYGTDSVGTVTVTSDGTSVTVETSGRSATTGTASAVTREMPTPTRTTPPAPQPTSTSCATGQVDINRASAAELVRIIHIGPVRAEEMLRLRPFVDVADLIRVDGIGAARRADIDAEGVACA